MVLVPHIFKKIHQPVLRFQIRDSREIHNPLSFSSLKNIDILKR